MNEAERKISFDIRKILNSGSGEFSIHIAGSLKKGSITALYGPSGAGKTSVLKMLAGILIPDNGYIKNSQKTWFENGNNTVSPSARNIAFVFQDYALFENMTILENLQFSQSKIKNEKIISDILLALELEELKDQSVLQLSGGQRQRVALGRALAQQADFLLMDEPLNALDRKMRKKLQTFIKSYHQEWRPTIIFVSHHIPEIQSLADQVMVIENGQLVECISPEELI